MPKIVSRGAVVSSNDAQETASAAASLRVYYCICGEFILVIDKRLSSLPKRNSDASTVIRCHDEGDIKGAVFKLNANLVEPILLERSGGHEKQFRFTCPRCKVPVGYQSTPPPVKSGPYIYILPGALTEMQGQVPEGAFDIEPEK